MPMIAAVLRFLRVNAVTAVSLLAAAVSFLFVADPGAWWQAIDLRTLNLLFCLMFVVAGFRGCALFRVLAQSLLADRKSFRALAHTLVQLTFFVSMVATNDVALIALVPFAVYALDRLKLRRRLPGLIALQTVAANLGSIATPIGNPQNLFLYTTYAIPAKDFFAATVPVAFGGVLLLFALTHILRNEPIDFRFEHHRTLTHPRKVFLCGGLLVLCLLTVFRLFPHAWLFGLVVVFALLFYRAALRGVDYGLLLTFVGFFVFSNNLGRIPAVSTLLEHLLENHTQATATLASQFLSNVPWGSISASPTPAPGATSPSSPSSTSSSSPPSPPSPFSCERASRKASELVDGDFSALTTRGECGIDASIDFRSNGLIVSLRLGKSLQFLPTSLAFLAQLLIALFRLHNPNSFLILNAFRISAGGVFYALRYSKNAIRLAKKGVRQLQGLQEITETQGMGTVVRRCAPNGEVPRPLRSFVSS